MWNGARLLLILALVIHSGCTTLVSIPKLSMRSLNSTGAMTGEANDSFTRLRNEQLHPTVDRMDQRAPTVTTTDIQREQRSANSERRRQRDLNFARVQKEVLARLEQRRQQQVAVEMTQLELPARNGGAHIHQDAATGSTTSRSVVGRATEPVLPGNSRLASSASQLAAAHPQEADCPTTSSATPGSNAGHRSVAFVTIVVLILSGMSWPLTRRQRRPSNGSRLPSNDNTLTNTGISTVANTDFSPDTDDRIALPVRSTPLPSAAATRALILLPLPSSDPSSLPSSEHASNSEHAINSEQCDCVRYPLILSMIARVQIASPVALLPVAPSASNSQLCLIVESDTNRDDFDSAQHELSLLLANAASQLRLGGGQCCLTELPITQDHPLIRSGNRQVASPREIAGILLLLTDGDDFREDHIDTGDFPFGRRIMIVESLENTGPSEFTAKVVRFS